MSPAPATPLHHGRNTTDIISGSCQCLYVKLGQLFERMQAAGIYDDSIMILHGEHGSRIVLTEPVAKDKEALNKQDIIDGFSTLFAVKLPGVHGGYDNSPRPLERLLEEVVSESVVPAIGREESEPFVYLNSGYRKKMVRVQYPVTIEQGMNALVGNRLGTILSPAE